MGGIFNLDGPFFKFGNIIADIMILSAIWFLFSIPIVTIGASTTALFYVTTRRISDREGYLFQDFFTSFKSNLKRATLLWLLWLGMFLLILANIYMLLNFDFNPTLVTILIPVQIVILVELVFMSVYLYPITARFEMDFKQTLKNSFYMANRHLLTTISCLVMGVAVILAAALIFEPILLVGMGIYAYSTSYMIVNIFKKYRPEIDAENLAEQPLKPLDINMDEDYTKEEPADADDREN